MQRLGESPSDSREQTGTSPLNPQPSPLNPSDAQLREANQRLAMLQAYWALQAQVVAETGTELSLDRAAAKLGIARSYLRRRLINWETGGRNFNALIPRFDKSGRKSILKHLTEQIGQETVENAIQKVSGLKLDTESNTAAWRLFAHSDQCPEALARVVLDPNRCSKHAIPESLREATKLNEALHNAHRGPRRLALKGMWTPRMLDILPGDIFTADDTTPIWAWWVPWRTDKEHPFGVKLMQGQFLPVIDVASQCAITFVLIAREKSSYRAADIWHLFGHTFDTIGLPRLGWQLERGSWESNLIAGVELEYRDGEATLHRRVGGLRQLPTNLTEWHHQKLGGARLPSSPDQTGSDGSFEGSTESRPTFPFPTTLQTWTSYLPKSKSVEAFFNRSQTFEGTLWGALGRDQMRKPYEKTKKLYEACRRGSADPRLHFLSQTEMVLRLRSMLDYLNQEPMEGEVFRGVPRTNFDECRAQHPLYTLPEEKRWLYRRDWKPVTITQGWARIRLTHDISGDRYSLFYTNARIFAEHEGEDVVVYYDRENFEAPAQIILARTGEHLCEAGYEERRGSFLEGDRTGHEIRSAWKNAVMSAYATIVPHAPSRQLPAEVAARRASASLAPIGGEGQGEGATRIVAAVPPPQSGSTLRRGTLPPAPTADQFARKQARLAEEADAARALREMQTT